ncbi:hypothetical protein [Streptomyces viridochromogenes]|nr:hypothetical protein [Streptomyces viridochromogenes]
MPTFSPTSGTGRHVGLAALVAAIVPATGPAATAQVPGSHPGGGCGTHD